MSNAKKCIYCGKPEDEHHEFESKEVPEGCQCDPWEWLNAVPAVCDTSRTKIEDEGKGSCGRCQHLTECHR